MIGGDFETVRGEWGIRGEVAAFVDDNFQAAALRVRRRDVVRCRASGSIGGPATTGSAARCSFTTSDRSTAAGFERAHAASDLSLVLSADRRFSRERYALRAFGVANTSEGSGFARAIATGELRDNLCARGIGRLVRRRGTRSGRPVRGQRLRLRATQILFLNRCCGFPQGTLALDRSGREQHLPAYRVRCRRSSTPASAMPAHLDAVARALGESRARSSADHPLASGSRRRRSGARSRAGRRSAFAISRRDRCRDGEVIAAGDGRLVALHTPGHAPDHFCFLDEATRDLYCGDLARRGGTIVDPRQQGRQPRGISRVAAPHPRSRARAGCCPATDRSSRTSRS